MWYFSFLRKHFPHGLAGLKHACGHYYFRFLSAVALPLTYRLSKDVYIRLCKTFPQRRIFFNFRFVYILDGFYFYIFTFTNLNIFSYNWLLTHSVCFSFSALIPSWEKLVYSFPSFHVLNILNISTIASITSLMSLDPNYSACCFNWLFFWTVSSLLRVL